MGDDDTLAAERVIALDARRCDAIIAGDIRALEDMITETFVYKHASGRLDTRASYLAARRAGAVRFSRFERTDLEVRVLESAVAVLSGRLRSWLTTAEAEKVNDHRFVGVWVKRGDDWRCASFEATEADPRRP
jgi:hypothetical protein